MPIHDWTRVDAGIFHDFHHEWISTIKRALNSGLLPPRYYALAEPIADGCHPDVLALSAPQGFGAHSPGNGALRPESEGGIALEDAPPKVRFTFQMESEQYANKCKHIAVRHRSGDEVVALVEIVSPGNKAHRFELDAFVEKTQHFLSAGIHLLILDLFPPGRRDPEGIHGAIWASSEIDDEFHLPVDKRLTLAAYAARAPRTAYLEPVAVGDALPAMPLFFSPVRYVLVPLEATYQAAFEAVPQRWREVLESPAGG